MPTFPYPTPMPETRSIKSEAVGQAVAAQVLLEKITDRETPGILSDLLDAARTSNWRVALDLSKVLLLTSAGLGALIDLNKKCAAGGGKLILHGLSNEILEVMKLTKLNKLLHIAASRDEAIKKAST